MIKSHYFSKLSFTRLIKANVSLNEDAAKLLLERALVVKNNKLEFSRDPMVRDQVN
jgi:hypothetical protein